MDNNQLSRLLTNQARTLTELRHADSETFDALIRTIGDERKRQIVNAAGEVSELSAEAIRRIDPAALAFGRVGDAVTAALKQTNVDERERMQVLDRVSGLSLIDPGALPENVAVGRIPAFRPALARAELAAFAARAGVREEAAQSLVEAAGDLESVSDTVVANLVEASKIDVAEARRLGIHVAFYHLANGDAAIAHALAGATFNTLGGPIRGLRDVATLPVSEVAESLRQGGIAVTSGTHEELAEAIRRRVVNLFADAVIFRPDAVDERRLGERLSRADKVIKANTVRFGVDFDDLDVSGISREDLDEVRTAYNEVVTMVRRYPGLGLERLVVHGGHPREAATAVATRVELLDKVVKANPDVELLALDYSPEGADLAKIDFADVPPSDRGAVLACLKAKQRVFAVVDDPDDAMPLMEAGYGGSTGIVADDFETFRRKTGLPVERAKRIHKKASETATGVALIVGSLVDVMRGGFTGLPIANVHRDVTDALRQIDGYADMFGPQDHCNCAHCSSILSPAAYFVDLMHFIENEVLEKVFVGPLASHTLHLEKRRGDLWKLDLTCANTTTLIPTLDVINEILESYLAKARYPAIDTTDRAAVRDAVYRLVLPQESRSLILPFVLPVVTADMYLELFEITRGAIARKLGAPEPRVAAAALKMGRATYDILIAENVNPVYLQSLFRVPFVISAGGAVNPVDVQPFLRGIGITHQELEALTRSVFVGAGVASTIRLVPDKSSNQSVQNDIERIVGLNQGVLDRMHRLLRLRRHTEWTLDEVDLVLQQRVAPAAAPLIDTDALRDVVAVKEVKQRFALPVDIACALWSRIPTGELVKGARSLFDRLFNNRPYTLTEGNLPQDNTRFVVPAFRTTPVPGTDNTLQRLLLGLQVDDATLTALVRGLATPLGCDPAAAAEANRGFYLTLANLTLLYRHATLARLLNRPAPDLFRLMSFAGFAAVSNLGELQSLIEFDAWFRASGLTLDDLAYITGGLVEATGQYPNPVAITADVIARVIDDDALTFAPTALAFTTAITEDLSRKILTNNAALFDTVADGRLRLKATVAPGATIVTPAGMPLAVASQVAPAIMRYHTANVLPAQIATSLRLPTEKLVALAAMAGIDLGSAAMCTALLGGARDSLRTAVTTLAKLATLFRPDVYTPARLNFMRSRRALFGVAGFDALSVPQVRAITRYKDLVTPPLDPTVRARDPEAVEDALAGFTAPRKFEAVTAARLGQALAVDEAAAAMLRSAVTLGNDAVEALGALLAVVGLVASTRLDIPTLALLSSERAPDLAAGAEALVSALGRLYPTDKDMRLEAKDDRIRSAKRDAVADYIIRESEGRFESLDDLYEYFLIDVQLQGCARTSRVGAAISSVQTYVHRILLNLEQDRRPEDPTHLHILPDQIPADEWIWRKNYRVWEANRKVFLWPENYIEPEIRNDKTPLFRALEEGLLQQDVNEQNVLDAYGSYLGGLESAAGVVIAGTYHEFNAASRTDVLHLFGATTDDPPEYYYWTITNLHHSRTSMDRRVEYSVRRKIDVSIPTRAITAVMHLGRLFVFWTETATNTRNQMRNGNFDFAGYKHQHRIKFTSLRLDGRWTAPQSMAFPNPLPGWLESDGTIVDPLVAKESTSSTAPMWSTTYDIHSEPQDGYSLRGPHWQRVALEPMWNGLMANAGGYQWSWSADLFERRFAVVPVPSELADALRSVWGVSRQVLHVGDDGAARRLYAPSTTPSISLVPDWTISPAGFQHLLADVSGTRAFLIGSGLTPATVNQFLEQLNLTPARRGTALGTLRVAGTVATGVAGASGGSGLILSAGTDALCLLRDPSTPDGWMGIRIGTTLVRELSRRLFIGGVEHLLKVDTQRRLGEMWQLLTATNGVEILRADQVGKIDFDGPLGVYFREVFFHIPFLIANHLNGRQNYRAAQSWYHYIFDPTARPDTYAPLSDMSADERDQALRDRVWRYIQFRGLTPVRLREILTQDDAIDAYKKDPFNPHAIARLRLSAYQKAVVMKYVSNLMDWGDSLFSQFETETINEATVLYVMASEILGAPPADVGDCGEANVSPRNYEKIRTAFDSGSEFLLEVESRMWIGQTANKLRRRVKEPSFVTFQRPDRDIAAARLEREAAVNETIQAAVRGPGAPTDAGQTFEAIDSEGLFRAKLLAGAGAMTAGASGTALPFGDVDADIANRLFAEGLDPGPSRPLDWKRTRAVGWEDAGRGARRMIQNDTLLADYTKAGRFAWAIVRQFGPVFCVPANKELNKLWGRVNDRLYKIRHCQDITGARRQPALFAPEIDPKLLVRAKAAGLSLDDLIGSASGNLPPYRFAFLIEKAKQFTASVQGFGGQLFSALEKRDVEELTRLRNSQQMNVLTLTTRMREWEVQIANASHDQLLKQKASIEYRRDYYVELMNTNLLPWERTQQQVRHMSTEFFVMGAIFGGTAGVLSLLPTLGAPTSIKYGGTELGRSMKGWSKMFSDTAKLLDVMSASIGLEAAFERRREGWEHQRKIADYELEQIERQITAAELRVRIAQRALEMHQKAMTDQEEIMDFFRDKFSNAGLYLWLSTSLQRLYRQAFNSAHSMAALAERAYRFERDDETTPLLQPTYWNSERAGLLAGEGLMTDLLELERRFLETNYRNLEIDQSFSVMQIAPAALVALREDGECDVTIPEIAFDLFYPGHYRRRIRAVRLTIPCVTGPYTNVSATLTLKQSFLRRDPKEGATNLIEESLRHTSSVATSTAQNDAGVFDFSFRDERYMPFEGAGAVSTWTVSLPKNFRPFDYRTITDVIVHLGYTALSDSGLRAKVESTAAATEGSLMRVLSTTPLPRAVSLRQEFSSAFQRAMASAPGTDVTFEIDERFLPIFLRGRSFSISRALLLLRPGRGVTGTGFSVRLGTQTISEFTASADFPGHREANALPGLTGGLVARHVFAIVNGGDLVPSPAPAQATAADPTKLADLILYVELTLTAPPNA